MAAPVGLWGSPAKIPLRMSVRPFREPRLANQARDIQQSQSALTISRGAMYMLAGVAGRRIVDPVRWVLLESVDHVLRGALRTEYPERQDLLGSTFGESFGAVLRAFQLGGDVEIVRLLDGASGKTPDFVLLQQTPRGEVAHLLECKGIVEDVNNANARKRRLDACQSIGGFRKHGEAQLDAAQWYSFETGERLVARTTPFALSTRAATKCLSVVFVPDARILRSLKASARGPNRAVCTNTVGDCRSCFQSFRNGTRSNLLTVFYEKDNVQPVGTRGGDEPILDPAMRRFIEEYRSGQRALWSEDDDALAESVGALLSQSRESVGRPDEREAILLAASALIDIGVAMDLSTEDLPQEEIARETRAFRSLPEGVVRPDRRLGAGDPNYVVEDGEFEAPSARYEWRAPYERSVRQVRRQEGLASPSDLLRHSTSERGTRLIARMMGAAAEPIRVVVENEGDVRVVRLTTRSTGPGTSEALQAEVERLIVEARREAVREFAWRDEYAALHDENDELVGRLSLGRTWELFPVPSYDGRYPGISAWVARDGRAEITIRDPIT